MLEAFGRHRDGETSRGYRFDSLEGIRVDGEIGSGQRVGESLEAVGIGSALGNHRVGRAGIAQFSDQFGLECSGDEVLEVSPSEACVAVQ